jgi:hypothetical protein
MRTVGNRINKLAGWPVVEGGRMMMMIMIRSAVQDMSMLGSDAEGVGYSE